METKILGSAFTVTSSLKTADIEALQRFSPKDLTLFDAEDKKTPVFKIGLDPCATLNRNGVSFNGVNAEGFAQATIGIPANIENKADYVTENYGLALLNLQEAEAAVAPKVAGLKDKFSKVASEIKVID